MERGDILGHEFMGEVVEVGRAVKNLNVGDRVVVPFPIACGDCNMCQRDLFSLCENSNPNAWMAEKLWGHSPAGHLRLLAHAGRVTPADRRSTPASPSPTWGRSRCPTGLTDEQVLFLSDIFPTGYMGAEMCDIKRGRRHRGVGRGPGGPVRHRQRQAARRGAGDRHRPLPLPACRWPRTGPAPPTSSTTRRSTSSRRCRS